MRSVAVESQRLNGYPSPYNSVNECRLIHSVLRANNYFNRFTDKCIQWNEGKISANHRAPLFFFLSSIISCGYVDLCWQLNVFAWKYRGSGENIDVISLQVTFCPLSSVFRDRKTSVITRVVVLPNVKCVYCTWLYFKTTLLNNERAFFLIINIFIFRLTGSSCLSNSRNYYYYATRTIEQCEKRIKRSGVWN